jgi:hypothetical protein
MIFCQPPFKLEKNLFIQLIDVSKILKSWQHRKLTLLGKVTVIITLALPKLIHFLLTSLIGIPLTSHPYYPCFRCINFQT